MIIEKRVKDFEKLGFGMFVHFGLYSELGKGEWAKRNLDMPWDEYLTAIKTFSPNKTWAKDLVRCAKSAGCRYITLTTRHHDGFSLYNTCGLSEFDAPHVCGRDLVKEFVLACREQEIIPFFYHTLLDWHEESYKNNFKEYLKYLRKSVEVLLTNYGEIGGFWFDGKWDKPNDDWEEDALYSLIRRYQPNSIIINNTGLESRGALGHIELDSVTFERGRPQPINLSDSPKYIASEMCETFASHWGYAKDDFNVKSVGELINTLCICRRYRSNLLLNVGPCGDGSLRTIDKGILEILGKWVTLNSEAIRTPEPAGIEVKDKPNNFILKGENAYYLFVTELGIASDPNVTINKKQNHHNLFALENEVKSVCWLDNGEELEFFQNGSEVTVISKPFSYGQDYVVRVAKINV